MYPYVYYPGLPNSEISAKAREVALVLDMKFMVRSTATTGAYNYAAISGVPSLLIERGGAGLCRREDIDAYKNDLHNILVSSNFFAVHSNNKNIPLLMSLTLFILKLIRLAVGSPVAVVATK